MKIRNRELNIFSMSALDLFASALGAFIILAAVALPFFPNTSILDDEQLQAKLEEVEEQRDELKSEVEKTKAEVEKTKAENRKLGEELQKFRIEDMDVVIVVDITNSMGDTVKQIKTRTEDLIRVLERMAPSLGIGIVAFGDHLFENVTTVHPISDVAVQSQADSLDRFIQNELKLNLGAGSGRHSGETPEELQAGIERAVRMNWRPESKERYIVAFTDAPVRSGFESELFRHVRQFASDPKRRLSAVISREGPLAGQTSNLLERVAAEGNGDFIDMRKGQSFLASMLLAIMRTR